jgi:hypothetical protein
VTLIGCRLLAVESAELTCRGAAPLTLTAISLVEGITEFRWSFAGAAPAEATTPFATATWPRAGRYEVLFVGGGASGGSVTSRATVVVEEGGVGATCGQAVDCASPLTCICAAGGCGAGLAAGLCTRPCTATPCGGSELCVDLVTQRAPPQLAPLSTDGGAPAPDAAALLGDGGLQVDGSLPDALPPPSDLLPAPDDLSASVDAGGLRDGSEEEAGTDGGPSDGGATVEGGARADAGSGWRQQLCLPSCLDDADCRPGLLCRELPTADRSPDGGVALVWRRGCFAALLGDVGDSCLDGLGQPDSSTCLSGLCLPLGARGICSSPCLTQTDCPSTARCARFSSAPQAGLCLPLCSASAPCADPLLDCLPPGSVGWSSYSTDALPSGRGLCAPRRCTSAAQCLGGAGRCLEAGGAGACVR